MRCLTKTVSRQVDEEAKGAKSCTGRHAAGRAGGFFFVVTLICWSTGFAQQVPLIQQSDTSADLTPPLVVKAQPTATPAAEAPSTFDAKFSAGITSDYNYRGYTLSDHLPSVSANGEAEYSIFFASVNVASVEMPGLSHFQMTDTLGLRRAFGGLTIETGGAIYSYPFFSTDPSYAEVYLSPSYTVTKQLTVGVNVFYAPDYYRMGAWENYNSLAAKYDIGWGLTFSAELGHQFFGTTSVGIAVAGLHIRQRWIFLYLQVAHIRPALPRNHADQTKLFFDNRDGIANQRIERLRSDSHSVAELERHASGRAGGVREIKMNVRAALKKGPPRVTAMAPVLAAKPIPGSGQ